MLLRIYNISLNTTQMTQYLKFIFHFYLAEVYLDNIIGTYMTFAFLNQLKNVFILII